MNFTNCVTASRRLLLVFDRNQASNKFREIDKSYTKGLLLDVISVRLNKLKIGHALKFLHF